MEVSGATAQGSAVLIALTKFSPTAPVRVGEDGHPGAEISAGERRAIN